MTADLSEKAPDPVAFEFDGHWPFTGRVMVAGRELATVSSWSVEATSDGIPKVTLTLVDGGALRLLLGKDAAKIAVSDETRDVLVTLGWTPPAGS